MKRLVSLFLILSTAALAQSAGRVHGTIAAVAPDHIDVRTEDGPVSVMVPHDVRIVAYVERHLADIRPGDFIASAAMRGRDGKLHAQEVRIFAESLRGVGEGHRPMGEPDRTMTNATVEGVTGAAGAGAVTVRYPGGEQTIEVAPDVRVLQVIVGDPALLVPGAEVTVSGTRAGDAITARYIQAEKDGVKPLP